MTAAEVMALIKEADLFEDGKMFDGSSIAGWKGINESDMILMPDPTSAVLDIFPDESTMNIRCDVVEPSTMLGYDRCPRSLAQRAEAYLQSTGVADAAYFGPENEFFVFDNVTWDDTMQGCFYKVDSEEGAWNTDRVIARPSKAATSRFRRLTHCTIFAARCASQSRKWA